MTVSREFCTFAPFAGESVVVIPGGFVPTHHTQLILTSHPATVAQPGLPNQGHHPSASSLALAPALGIQAGLAGRLQAVGAVGVGGMAGMGRGGGRGSIEGEGGGVDWAVLLLAVGEALEVEILVRVAQRVPQHICMG